MDKELIRQRLQTDSVRVISSRTPLFGAVPESKIRFVVLIRLHGDGVSSKTVDIEKLEEDGSTYTMKYEDIPIPPASAEEIPKSEYDIENPIVTCEGGTRLYGTLSAGGTVNAAIHYWDNEV